MSAPAALIEMLRGVAPEAFDTLDEQLSTPPEVAVRNNVVKGNPAHFTGEAVPWCPGALHLDVRPQFTLDPWIHQGRYYVQDASSMFISHVIRHLTRDGRPVAYLDACAAPGGKTTCALDALPPGSMVVANEAVPKRAAVLRENVIKWGRPEVIVTRGDGRALGRLREQFDIIAADVPCSGEGMMRKDPQAVEQWSPALVEQCASLQWEIVESLWDALKPGGYLIYSTCTFNTTENEDMTARMAADLGAEPVEIPIDPEWGIVGALKGDIPAYRFIPGRVRGEGLFMSVVRKPGEPRHAKEGKPVKGAKMPREVASWLRSEMVDRLAFTTEADRISALPASMMPLLATIEKTRNLDVIHHGVTVANVKGRDLIPAHSLAMSSLLNRDAFPSVAMERDRALDYLRREAVTLDAVTPRGHVLLTHDGAPLGWVKNLGNRANNLYPEPWRILIR